MKWSRLRHKLLVKSKRGVLGNFTLVFEDTINNCILHEYHSPIRQWERWELEVIYGVFKMQLKEIME